jgi:hypothetical protein
MADAESVTLQMFDQKQQMRPEYFETGNEMYRFAFKLARGGVESSNNRLVRAIQGAAFDALSAHAILLTSQLDQAIRDIDGLSATVDEPHGRRVTPTQVPQQPTHKPNQSLCEALGTCNP